MFGLPSRLLWTLVAAVILGAVLTAAGTWGWFNDDEDVDENSEILVEWLLASVLPILIAAAIVAYTGVRLWRGGGGGGLAKGALVFGILAAVSLPAFWMGIYLPFGAGAIVFGLEAVRRGVTGPDRAMAWAGMALAAVAIVAYALLNLFG